MPLNIWAAVTYIGDPLLWLYLSAVLFFMYFIIRDNCTERTRRFFKVWIIILIPSLLISLGMTSIIKNTLQIERPCIPCLEGTENCNEFCPTDSKDYSFPSGHSVTAFAAFSSMFLAVPRRKYLPIFIIPLLVAVSRVALGVHAIGDIAAGSLIGLVLTLIIWKGGNKLIKK